MQQSQEKNTISTKDAIRSYEKKARNNCLERTQQNLTLNASAGSIQSQTLIGFIKGKEEYNDEECIRYRNHKRSKEKRPIAKFAKVKNEHSYGQGTDSQQEAKVEEDEWFESKEEQTQTQNYVPCFEVAMDESKGLGK